MAQPKKARGGFPYLWAIAGFCLVGVLAFVIRWSPGTAAYDLKVREDRLARLEELKKAAEEKLSGYRWVDQEKKIVGLPIERAMELAATELKSESVGPSDVQAVSTGSLIVPPYLKAAQEQPAEEAAAPAEQEGTAPAPAAEGTPAAEPEGEAAPAPAAQEEAPATPAAPATEATPEAGTPAETPAAPTPSAEDGAAAQPTASPAESTGEAAPDATAENPIGD